MDNDIGARLKSIRTQRRLSQRQLARQSGVANATISQIEAGKLNPTVSMLKKVLGGIPMSLGEFFGDAFESHERVFFRSGELTEIADGGVSFRQVGANLPTGRSSFIQECYQPGVGHRASTPSPTRAKSAASFSAAAWRSRLANRRTVLTAGDAYYFQEQPAAPVSQYGQRALRADHRLHTADVLGPGQHSNDLPQIGYLHWQCANERW